MQQYAAQSIHPKSLRALFADDLVSLRKNDSSSKDLEPLEFNTIMDGAWSPDQTAVVKWWQDIGAVEANQSPPREKPSQTTHQSELMGDLRHYLINMIGPFQIMVDPHTK